MTAYGTQKSDLPQDVLLSEAERDMLAAHRPGYGSRSKIEVAFNLINSTVGAGIIGLPFAIYLAGFWRAIVLSVIVSILSVHGMYLLIAAGKRVGAYKFAVLMEFAMGRFGFHFLNLIMIIQAGGACVSYFILIGDTIPVLLELYFPQYPSLTQRELVTVFIAIFFVLPLNLSRSLGALSRWSILSVLCLPVILIMLLIRAPSYASSHDAPLNWAGPDLFGSLGILAFAFTCTHVCFSVYLSLKDQTIGSWTISTGLAAVVTWAVSIAFAMIGYLSFGSDVQPNLFLNFPPDDPLVNIGRFALGFSMVLTIPMAFNPTRQAVQKMLGFETATHQPSSIQHYTTTIILFSVITALGATVRSLGKVYTLLGGFSATFLAYILPAIACLVTRRYPAVEIQPLLAPTAVRRPASSSTEEEALLSEAAISVVPVKEEEDFVPKFGLLDASAIVLLLWGLIVMVFSTSGVLFT